jgi:hypothetical protein
MLRLGFALAATALSGACTKSTVATAAIGIPFACEGRAAIRAAYDGGGARAKVWLWMDGERVEMNAAPTLDGLRYMKPVRAEDKETLAWATDGVNATLIQVPVGAMGGEEDRIVATCRREGWDLSDAHPAKAAAEHSVSTPHD